MPRFPAALSRLPARIASLGAEEHTILLVLAVIIGTMAGLVVGVFYRAIDFIQEFALESAARIPAADLVAIPLVVIGGLALARALVRYGAADSDGGNVADVMYRVTVKGGVVHSVPVIFKTLAAAVTIGTGGSAGAEGPVIVAGAATASRIGRWLRASSNRLRTLVGCGAAAGISAAFNAPIAGVIFGVEKILGSVGGLALGPFVVASILAATVGRAIFGNQPVMALPAEFSVGSSWELLLYALLGIVTGVVAVVYSRGVWRAHDFFGGMKAHWRRVLLAGVIVGALDLAFRADLWGRGHESLDIGIVAARSATFLLALAAAKLIATAVTLAAAGAGGVFTPALFIGATAGGAIGVAVRDLLPGWGVAPGAVALVGMAGVVAGATHAPLTAIMMVFEMTADYGLILPLMLTSVIAYATARRLHPESVYTEWLARRGVHLSHGADAALLARVPVSECLNRRPVTLKENAPLAEILAITRVSRQTDFPVVGDNNELVGMVNLQQLREATAEGSEAPVASQLASRLFDRVTSEDSILTALRRLGSRDVNFLPVVDKDEPNRLLGIVSRQDLLAAYEKALTAEPQ
jgi:CIC family chloride channel protein